MQADRGGRTGARWATDARWLHIGCYTAGAGGEGEGIVSARRDVVTGLLGEVGHLRRCAAPSFLAAHPDGHSVYAVHEQPAGMLTRLGVEPTGSLAVDRSVSSGGAGPCHLEVTSDRRHLLATNYASGSVVGYRLGGDGVPVGLPLRLEPPLRGATAAHPHMVTQHAGTRSLLVVDLGLDHLRWYGRDEGGEVDPILRACTRLATGSGPRRVVFHPAGLGFVLNELNSTVTVLDLPAGSSAVRALATVPTSRAGVAGNYPSEMALSDDGRRLYTANRGHDTISVLAVSDTALTLLAEVPSGGEWPQHFVIIGGHLYVANQRAHHIAVHELDPDTGIPVRIRQRVQTASPSCLLPAA